jgi:hypothetical protein
MTEVTLAMKLQMGADLIADDAHKRGMAVTPAECLALARRMFQLWEDRHEIRSLAPGDVAQRFRKRYGTIEAHGATFGPDGD